MRPLSSSSSSSSSPSSSTDGRTLLERATDAVGMSSKRTKVASEKMNSQLASGAGWRAALEVGLVEQQRLKRQEMVAEQLEQLAEMQTYGFDDLANLLKRSLHELENGITQVQKARLFADKMSGGSMQDTIDTQKATAQRKLSILNELTVHEKRQPKLLDLKARRAIATKLGIDVKAVHEILFEYQMQRAQWSFVRRERLRGRPVPKRSADLEWMMKIRPPREFIHVMKAYEAYRQELTAERNAKTTKR